MGMASSYAQCSGGLFRNGVSDDMSVISAAGVAGTGYAPKGYYGVNWYPTPDSVVNTVSDPNYFSYQKYQLSRLTNPGKMTVTANAADTLFRTFGIGFSVPVDLSNAATMSIDVDNSAQPNTPLFFTANLTDWNGYQIQYMADTLSQYNALYPLYDDSYKKKFTDTISASTSTVYTSYKATPWYVNNSGYSTTNSVTTVNFNFAGGWQIDSALSD